jgi:quinol-cytochrome oxidoreductase complex cytochrome b subunit
VTIPLRPPCTDGEAEPPRLRVVPAPREGRIAGTALLRGERLLTLAERPLLAIEAAVARALPESVNQLAQPGAMANALLLIVVATGILLLPVYSPSLSGAHDSVAALDAAPRSLNLLRSVHRLASDAAIAFVLLHALRALLPLRVAGARWIAWSSGVGLLAITWLSTRA